MSTKALKEAEKKLKELEKKNSQLEQRLEAEKEKYRVEKQKSKSLAGKLERREACPSTLKKEVSALKKEVSAFKKKLSIPAIPLTPIDRHKYPEFTVSMLSDIYMTTGCGFRKTVKVFELLNERLGWGMEEIPCFNSLENWIKKPDCSIYGNPALKASDADCGMVTDESIVPENERFLPGLEGKVGKSTANPLSYGDVEISEIHVDSNWKASGVQEVQKEDKKKNGEETGVYPK